MRETAGPGLGGRRVKKVSRIGGGFCTAWSEEGGIAGMRICWSQGWRRGRIVNVGGTVGRSGDDPYE